MLESAGFSKVQADDRTDLFVHSLKSELVRTENMKEAFVKVSVCTVIYTRTFLLLFMNLIIHEFSSLQKIHLNNIAVCF